MNIEQQFMVHRLEVCLSDIRKIAGWKGVELGNMLGLSRQAISTLEKQNSRLTFAQYVAVRHLLDAWMDRHPENKTLRRVVTLLLDDRRIFGDPYNALLHTVGTISAIASSGADINLVDKFAMDLLDEWECSARKICNEQLKQSLMAEKLGVTADTKPGDWTEKIFTWR